jgi:hypothetical protein
MKLEHRKQKIVPFSTFLVRLGRYAIFAMLLIIFSVFIGMIGYHYFGQLTWLDSFHMSCMILTGMGPVVEMKTDGGENIFFIFCFVQRSGFFKHNCRFLRSYCA